MTFYITTFGCKVNQYESQFIRESMIKEGFIQSDCSKDADINIINSCTVTATADAKNRKVVNRIRRENISTIIVLCGCMPQTVPFDDDAIYDKCDLILGNQDIGDITNKIKEYIENRIKTVAVRNHENGELFEDINITEFDERTRAFLKIEDGCNQFCTYCTIPYARGRVRSKTLVSIKNEATALAENGYKEIVLVGINLSCFGMEENLDISDAVSAICSIDKIKRVRLGSFEPERLTEEIIKRLSEEEKFCPQFHLSLQSGCNDTLKRMHRHYSNEEYYLIVENIRKYFDNPSITTDVMIGFAGESENEFNESLSFVDKVKFSKVHIFPYSRRKGTKAYSYDNQIDDETKKIRCEKMDDICLKNRKDFLSSQVGRTEEILFERKDENDLYSGYTKNYTKVKVNSVEDISNEILSVKITSVVDDYCIGELCKV